MAGPMQLNRERIIEELRKDPGRSAKNIARSLGLDEDSVRKTIKKWEGTQEPELEKIMEKRKAYAEGGSQLVKVLRETPGASYQKIIIKLKAEAAKENVRDRDTTELFIELIGYCKKREDAELREIFLRHKKMGGWMPGGSSQNGIRYSEKVKEELRKKPERTNLELRKATGLSHDTLSDVLRKMKESKEPEALMLLAKRDAYLDGGAALAEVLRTSPGAKYPEIAIQLLEKTKKSYDIPKVMERLIEYAKKHKDEGLKEIMLKHKKAGGWMP